jgi:hypothetical protein
VEYVETTRAQLEQLAARCEQGAARLKWSAENAAAELADRGYAGQVDPDEWGARKMRAAVAAAEYASGLRREAAELGEAGTPTAERVRQAERVAKAAESEGILIDGRPMAERTAATADALSGEADKIAWEAGTHPTQEKAAEIEGSGVFGHVNETIDGRAQVPFWQLGGWGQEATLAPAQQELYDSITAEADWREAATSLPDEAASVVVVDEQTGPEPQAEMQDEHSAPAAVDEDEM